MVVKNPKRIALWSSPRLMSTALMYGFSNRSDTNVVDEPLHAYYLGFSAQEIPWRMEVLKSMDKDPSSIMNTLMYCDLNRPILFVKSMAHQVIGLQWDFLREFKNFFLIQDPGEVVSEFVNSGISPTKIDISFEVQYQMLLYLIEQGVEPIVVNANDLRRNPEVMMEAICAKFNIPFEASMSALEVDRTQFPAWGSNCYSALENIHSMGDVPHDNKVPQEYEAMIEELRPSYDRLNRYSLKV